MAFQDFDEISNRRKEERKQRLKKRITIAIASTVAVLVLIAAAIGTVTYVNNQKNKSQPAPKEGSVAEKAVESVCVSTDYKQTCENSLLKAVKTDNVTQPKDLVKVSFVVVSEEIDNVIKQASELKFDTPQKKAAFDDCLVLLNDAKEELNSSISSVHDLNGISTRTPDINNWLSAVLSYQQTCIDGFPDEKEKSEFEKLMKNAKELGSNALAIVAEVLKAEGGHVARSLLASDKHPRWMNGEQRRMLKADISEYTPNVTVAKDGSGNFSTVTEALNAMPEKYTGRYFIYVKEGVYEENVIVTKKQVNVTMYGDGSQKSVISGSKNFVDGVPTFQTATFAAIGDGFMAQGMGFRNTAGPEKHQAVALRVQSDRSIFLNCRMEGYQDTLYAQTHRQFYRSCFITGTVDFIFGDAAAVFQNSMIYVRKPMDNQQNIVTAQGRLDKRQTTGIVIQNCRILPNEELEPEQARFKSYLGRPWKEYSRTVIMESKIEDFIHPEGWMEWNGDFALKTLYYAEFNNAGPGSNTSGRVKWPGYRVITKEEAFNFTIGPFLQGESWLKNVDIPTRFGMYT